MEASHGMFGPLIEKELEPEPEIETEPDVVSFLEGITDANEESIKRIFIEYNLKVSNKFFFIFLYA